MNTVSDIDILMMIQSYEAWRYDALSIDQKNKLACLRELQVHRANMNDIVPLLIDGCDFVQQWIDPKHQPSYLIKNRLEAWTLTVKSLIERIRQYQNV